MSDAHGSRSAKKTDKPGPAAKPAKPLSAAKGAKPASENSFDLLKPMREFIGARAPKDLRARIIILAILAILTAVLFGFLLSTGLSAMEKFLGSALIMMVAGEAARGLMKWEGFAGLIMLKDRSTLDWIDRQAKRFAPLWSVIADVGIVLGYGLAGYRLLGPQARKPRELALIFILGFLLLLIFSAVILPSAYDILRMAVGGGDLKAASEHMRTSAPLQGDWNLEINGQTYPIPLMALLMLAVLIGGGLASSAMLSLLLYAASLVVPLVAKVVSIALELLGQEVVPAIVPPPGGTPLLPGINLDLVSGVIAMAVLLVVHELSHAFLARIHGIRLDSAGVVFFGILPFGAFVDPDEKELEAAAEWRGSQVLAAGSAMNMIVAVAAFAILLGLSMLNAYQPINGIVVTFIARCLALIVALNVLVGVVNLLPLPMFDGHRLMKSLVRNRMAAHLITLLAIAAFVVNFLPWLFR